MRINFFKINFRAEENFNFCSSRCFVVFCDAKVDAKFSWVFAGISQHVGPSKLALESNCAHMCLNFDNFEDIQVIFHPKTFISSIIYIYFFGREVIVVAFQMIFLWCGWCAFGRFLTPIQFGRYT